MSLDGDISAAVDRAAGGDSGQPPTTPASPSATATPAAASPSATPTAGSGLDSAATDTVPQGAATTQPTVAGDPTQDAPTSQEPPKEKWETILNNARSKTRDQFGIPADAEPQKWAPHIRALTADPVAYHRALGDMLRRSGVQLQDTPPAPQQLQAPTQPRQRPTPDLVSQDGKEAYSAKAMEELLDYQLGQFEQRMRQTLDPIQQHHEQAQVEQMYREADAGAQAILSEAAQWVDFDKYRSQIGEMMRADKRWSLEGAYNKLFQADQKNRDKELKTKTRQDVLNELKLAPTSTGVTPGAATPQASKSKRGSGSLDRDIDAAFNHAVSTLR